MANTLRIKRRASGASGAPSSLENAELAYNEVDDILYYGKGSAGTNGTATTIEAIAGAGAVVRLTGNQTVAGVKTFSSTITGSVSGNAGTATKLATARNLSLTGDATATLTGFDGSANVSAALTLTNSGVTANTYGSASTVGQFTVNAKGLITSASSITLTTANITENTNLYYTDARVRLNRLDQMAAPTAAVSMNSQKITNLATPTSDNDAANKAYVDGVAQGLDVKPSVVVATTANITLSGAQTIDTIAVVAGDRVLVKNQTNATQNGIYVVATGAWTRATDADAWTELVGAFTFVERGSQADTGWVCTVDAGGTLGTTNVAFTQFSGAGSYVAGDGLTLSGNTFNVGGTTNRITVSANAVDIAANYVGQNTITTLGTVSTGTWSASPISIAYGGTGSTNFTENYLVKTGSGNMVNSSVYDDGLGKVGIGTFNPSTALHVNASADAYVLMQNDTGNAAGYIAMNSSGSMAYYSIDADGAYLSSPAVFKFVTNGTEKARITSTGNVGIGTTTPGQMLTVAGTVESTTGGFKFPDGTTQTTAAVTGTGTVTSVAVSGGTTGLTTSGGPITSSGTITLAGTLAVANGGTGATTASAARTNLGATTVGANLFTLTNPAAVTFPRFNADNTVSALDAATFRTAIGAGTGSGTVTSVAVSGGTTGLTTSGGPITGSGTITLAGTLGVANGGTGATTLTGYIKGNGTSAFTASATIPNTDISGLGTMSTQAASNVAITGGSIDGITIDGGTF